MVKNTFTIHLKIVCEIVYNKIGSMIEPKILLRRWGI